MQWKAVIAFSMFCSNVPLDESFYLQKVIFTGFLHICQVTRIWRVTPGFLYFRPHSKHSPAFTRVLIKSPTITHILFDGNEIAETNLFAGRKEKYWS